MASSSQGDVAACFARLSAVACALSGYGPSSSFRAKTSMGPRTERSYRPAGGPSRGVPYLTDEVRRSTSSAAGAASGMRELLE